MGGALRKGKTLQKSGTCKQAPGGRGERHDSDLKMVTGHRVGVGVTLSWVGASSPACIRRDPHPRGSACETVSSFSAIGHFQAEGGRPPSRKGSEVRGQVDPSLGLQVAHEPGPALKVCPLASVSAGHTPWGPSAPCPAQGGQALTPGSARHLGL